MLRFIYVVFKFIKECLCGHEPTDYLKSETVSKHKKRHYYECKKCGKKVYVD